MIKLNYYNFVLLTHILFIGPVIIAYAYLHNKSPKFLRNMTITLGILAVLSHSYRFIKINFPLSTKNETFTNSTMELTPDSQYYIDRKNKKKINRECPHMGCNVNYDSNKNEFICPCHQSKFQRNGSYVDGSCQDSSWGGENLSVESL